MRYVICIKYKGVTHYLCEEKGGVILRDGTKREPEGIFSPILNDAIFFNDKWWAQCICASYQGAVVKTINQIFKMLGVKEGGC